MTASTYWTLCRRVMLFGALLVALDLLYDTVTGAWWPGTDYCQNAASGGGGGGAGAWLWPFEMGGDDCSVASWYSKLLCMAALTVMVATVERRQKLTSEEDHLQNLKDLLPKHMKKEDDTLSQSVAYVKQLQQRNRTLGQTNKQVVLKLAELEEQIGAPTAGTAALMQQVMNEDQEAAGGEDKPDALQGEQTIASISGTSLGATSLGGTSFGGTSYGGVSLGGTSLGGLSRKSGGSKVTRRVVRTNSARLSKLTRGLSKGKVTAPAKVAVTPGRVTRKNVRAKRVLRGHEHTWVP